MAQRRLLTTAVPAAILVAAWTVPGQAVGQAYDVAQLEQRIIELEKRVKQLEGGLSRLRVPVDFVDSSGAVVAQLKEYKSGGALILNGSEGESTLYLVGDGGVLFDRGNASVALGVGDDGRGSLVIKSDEQTIAKLTSSPDDSASGYLQLNGADGGSVEAIGEGGVVVTGDGDLGSVEIGLYGDGEGSEQMGVYVEKGGALVAALGSVEIGGGAVQASDESGEIRAILSGTGEIQVANESGQTLATMTAKGDFGAFQVMSGSWTTLASLSTGAEGGLFQLANNAGNAVVEAGVIGGSRGLVRAYPVGAPAGGMVGMPGTFIMGWGGK